MSKKKDVHGKDVKARSWTFILYEDSTNIKEFQSKIKELGKIGLRAMFIKHDKDLRADGTIKKNHWHVIIIWDSPTTYNNALKVIKNLSESVEHIEAIRSLVGAARYLTHMDDADKFQYSKEDVYTVGDIEYSEMIESSRNDRLEVKAMAEHIQKNEVTSFDKFAYYCLKENAEWFRILSERNTFFFRNLIQAQHFRLKEERISISNSKPVVQKIGDKYINVMTGEIIKITED